MNKKQKYGKILLAAWLSGGFWMTSSDVVLAAPDALEAWGKINLLKGGIVFADAITTVSPTYAKEILAEPGGNGLAQYLQRRGTDFEGILNGADYDIWNPETDRRIPARYRAHSLIGKGLCKAELQEQLGLTFVMVTHEPELAECADRIVTILDGKVCSNVLQDEETKKKNRDALFADLEGDLDIGGEAAKEQKKDKK